MVDLRALAEDILRSLEPQLQRRQITAEVVGAARYRAYPDDMRQLLKNLIENAVKYNREGGRVEVRIAPDAYQCVIGVSDTGIGIPLEHQSRVFERFYRVDKGRSKRREAPGSASRSSNTSQPNTADALRWSPAGGGHQHPCHAAHHRGVIYHGK